MENEKADIIIDTLSDIAEKLTAIINILEKLNSNVSNIDSNTNFSISNIESYLKDISKSFDQK